MCVWSEFAWWSKKEVKKGCCVHRLRFVSHKVLYLSSSQRATGWFNECFSEILFRSAKVKNKKESSWPTEGSISPRGSYLLVFFWGGNNHQEDNPKKRRKIWQQTVGSLENGQKWTTELLDFHYSVQSVRYSSDTAVPRLGRWDQTKGEVWRCQLAPDPASDEHELWTVGTFVFKMNKK